MNGLDLLDDARPFLRKVKLLVILVGGMTPIIENEQVIWGDLIQYRVQYADNGFKGVAAFVPVLGQGNPEHFRLIVTNPDKHVFETLDFIIVVWRVVPRS